MKNKMKKNFVFSVAALFGVMTLLGCSREVLDVYEQDEPEPTSVLHVFTREGTNGATAANVPDPVCLYVFNALDQCVRMVPEVTQETVVRLPGGTFEVYAVAGADPSRYDLPSLAEAEKESEITLLSGQKWGDLMVSQAQVMATNGADNSLTLSMNRVVMGIREITIRKVPSSVESVSITISPLYESLRVDGGYSGSKGSFTQSLSLSDDEGTWHFAEDPEDEGSPVYLLPSVGKPTITVSFVTGESTKNYSYASSVPLEANHKLVISGTYTEEAKLQLSGLITGSEWDSDTSISFDFDETSTSTSTTTPTDPDDNSGDDNSGNSGNSGDTPGDDTGGEQGGETSQTITLPEVGTLYQNQYYVLCAAGDSITLLYSEAKQVNIPPSSTSYSEALGTLAEELEGWNTINPIGAWRMPNKKEATAIVNQATSIKARFANYNFNLNYYCLDNDNLYSFKGYVSSSSTINFIDYNKGKGDSYIFPVSVVKFSSSNP